MDHTLEFPVLLGLIDERSAAFRDECPHCAHTKGPGNSPAPSGS
ncbi:hypothetical protein ACIRP7_25625 [Streptomyces sp. NPDC102270]